MKTVFVGLSGGVDSSVSAYLLKKANPNNFQKLFGRPTPKGFRGFNVVGAFIKTWQPDFVECSWKEERKSAMRVSAHLNIPFITIDLEKEYKEGVADYMIEEYKNGRTPNPDVMCNKEIKFKAFLNKAIEMGADYIATGHYAQIKQNSKEKKIQLSKAKDKEKEQSYFLWTLSQKELSRTLFPIGHLKKEDVRKIAKKAGLHTYEKKDSQGICFIGKIDFKDFLKHYILAQKGNVLDIQGNVIGNHDGAYFLTIGERHGFTINKKTPDDEALYVIEKDIEKNTITVGKEKTIKSKQRKEFELEKTNWINEIPEKNNKYDAQIRYHGEYQKCIIKTETEKTKIIFDNPQMVASGQSVVVYGKDICLGGGIAK